MDRKAIIDLIERKLISLKKIKQEPEFRLQASASISHLEWVLKLLKQESEYAN